MLTDLRLLLVEPDEIDADHVLGMLREAASPTCGVERAGGVVDALRRLRCGAYDVVLIDALVEGAGPTEGIAAVRLAADAAPVMLLQHRDRPGPIAAGDVGELDVIDVDHIDARGLGLQLTAAVERRRLERALQEAYDRQRALATSLGARDPLTGLWSAPILLERIGELIADAVRFRRPLSVCILDIDGFGKLNAQRGPATADAVLVHLAALVQQQMRACDLLGRWGADALLVVLPGTPPEAVRVLVDRLQAAMRVLPYEPPDGRRLHVSASFGIAGLHGLLSAEALVGTADAALHRAQGRGRGSVEVQPELVAVART